MIRGPQVGKGRNGADKRSFVEKARDATAWGEGAPEWVVALAELADHSGLGGAAAAIGYSDGLVSTVLRNSYKGDVDRVAEKVQGALLGKIVVCPVIGEMSRNTCIDWQNKPKAATSAYRMRMFHACRDNCPNFRPKGGTDVE